MTLYRQLIILTIGLFFVLLVGTWMITFQNNRTFVINQLSSHAQDTATSLALAISQYPIEKDSGRIEAMIDAVFDRGYYEIIKLTDLEGTPVSERKLKIVIEDVPRWFVFLVPIETPEASSHVITGWRQTGVIYVKSHPGYAYQTLWLSSLRTSMLFIVCGLLVVLAGAWGLRRILQPLSRVEEQADAICRKEYFYQEILPGTKELRQVVVAMNRMVKKVQTMFEEQVAVVEDFRRSAYFDALTGLGNRRYLESQVKAYFDERGHAAKGIFILVELNDLNALNQARGLDAGDTLLKRAAEILQDVIGPFSHPILARLTGGDFCVFLPDALPEDAESTAAAITNRLSGLAPLHIPGHESIAHVGAVIFSEKASLGLILAEADRALRLAQQTAPNTWRILTVADQTAPSPAGQQQWKAALEKALNNRGIRLEVQPVVKPSDKTHLLHLEIFARIIVPEEGHIYNADRFLPYAERLGMTSLLDRMVLEEVFKLNRQIPRLGFVAVNISPTSLADASFMAWFRATLPTVIAAPRITFEFPEFAAIHNLPLIRDFKAFVQTYGHGVAIDHFGEGMTNFAYLHSLQPEYVKISRAYTGEIKDAESDMRFFIASLCTIAHSVDVAIIAEGIETEWQFNLLGEMHLDGAQGFFIDVPQPISSYLHLHSV